MTNPSDSTTPGPGLLARAVGMVVAPVRTLTAVIGSPSSAGILFLVCLVTSLSTALPQFTESGRRAVLALQVEQVERFTGQPVSTEQYIEMERTASFTPYFSIVGSFIFIPFMTVIFSAVYWALFNIVFAGSATFGQVLAVTAHAQVLTALGTLLGAPIQWLQGTFSQAGPFNLGALVFMLDPSSGLVLFFSALTIFGLWQAAVSGLGISLIYRQPPAGVVTAVLLIYFATTALFAVGLPSAVSR